ncbi:MAG: PLP-dependent cysteine synthase family protein [Myxococcota bacterium]
MSLPLLPTLGELLDPSTQPSAIRAKARASADPLDPIHLFGLSWRATGEIPHVVLPTAMTGVRANVVVMSGRRFPTGSHKVGPAYSVLREKLLDGEITQDGSTLVFPSTGNYGIGGAWVGPRCGFRSLVVLPEDMSAERFEKIAAYGAEVVKTPGSESNVKEIYDAVKELRKRPGHRILNQFEELGNYRFHHHVTGNSALALAKGLGNGRVAAFVSAMGSAGTIAAADRIKRVFPDARAVGVEPIQCPTLWNVGYGAHAIEGIGDKHVTWIHDVRNMDALACVDDERCLLGLQLVEEGDLPELAALRGVLGVSGVCNVLAAIKTAKLYDLRAGENVLTVATDGFDRYPSVLARLRKRRGPPRHGLEVFHDVGTDWMLEGTMDVRRRWHNQKYFTWVEQQNKSVAELNALWDPAFWEAEAEKIEALDRATLALRRGGDA